MKNNEDPHFLTGNSVFSFYYHISKSVLPATFQKWRFFLFLWQPRTSPFHITRRSLVVNQQSSHGKADVPQSGEQLRCSEMRLVCSSWGCCLISPHSPCQGLTLAIDFCTAEPPALFPHCVFSLDSAHKEAAGVGYPGVWKPQKFCGAAGAAWAQGELQQVPTCKLCRDTRRHYEVKCNKPRRVDAGGKGCPDLLPTPL